MSRLSSSPKPNAKTSKSSRSARSRSVASRVLWSFAVVTAAFALVAGWGVLALGTAARQTQLVRAGYVPLTRTLRDLVTLQDTWNTQLNHVTSARNPADARLWFDSALRIGRPKKFAEARAAITLAFARSKDRDIRAVGRDLLADTRRIERALEPDADEIRQLFEAIENDQPERAERMRDRLVKRGLAVHRRIARLDRRVLVNVDALSEDVVAQERFAIRLLVALSIFTVFIGLLMAALTRRVLAPLGEVTRRARVVASGDLTPHPVVVGHDEIGELASNFEAMVAAIADIREKLLASERLAAVGKMAAHVTHEIRNPLSSIALNMDLLEEEVGEKNAEARTLIRAVQAEVDRLRALSEQYLSIARDRPAQLEPEDLVRVVSDAAEFMRPELKRHDVELTIFAEARSLNLRVDEAQIRQAVFNLLRNAREAMSDGGEVTVRISGDSSSGGRITVQDTGGGVDPAVAAHLFDPFVTTKSTGTGLGLAVTRRIVEGHGGSIICESADSRGARFVIELPPSNIVDGQGLS